MDIVWENNSDRGPDGLYRVLFMHPGTSGAIRHQTSIRGEEALRDFFLAELLDRSLAIEKRKSRADEWLKELHAKEWPSSTLSLSPASITKELFEKLSSR